MFLGHSFALHLFSTEMVDNVWNKYWCNKTCIITHIPVCHECSSFSLSIRVFAHPLTLTPICYFIFIKSDIPPERDTNLSFTIIHQRFTFRQIKNKWFFLTFCYGKITQHNNTYNFLGRKILYGRQYKYIQCNLVNLRKKGQIHNPL